MALMLILILAIVVVAAGRRCRGYYVVEKGSNDSSTMPSWTMFRKVRGQRQRSDYS